MKIFKLQTDYECLIDVNGEQCLLSPNENIEVGDCKILVYPIGTIKNIPFCIETSSLKNSVFYKYIEIDKDSTVICLLNNPISDNYTISRLSTPHGECLFKISKRKLKVCHKNWEKEILLDEPYSNFNTKLINNIACIKLSDDKNSRLFAFNLKTGAMRSYFGNIELNNSGFKVNDDIYKINSQGLMLESSKKRDIPCEQTLVYNFLNYLKYDDLANAYSLCSDSLQTQISKNDINRFFGRIASFYPVSTVKYVVLANDTLKLYNFKIENNLITDIEQ